LLLNDGSFAVGKHSWLLFLIYLLYYQMLDYYGQVRNDVFLSSFQASCESAPSLVPWYKLQNLSKLLPYIINIPGLD
jgi:hypothetical protein